MLYTVEQYFRHCDLLRLSPYTTGRFVLAREASLLGGGSWGGVMMVSRRGGERTLHWAGEETLWSGGEMRG